VGPDLTAITTLLHCSCENTKTPTIAFVPAPQFTASPPIVPRSQLLEEIRSWIRPLVTETQAHGFGCGQYQEKEMVTFSKNPQFLIRAVFVAGSRSSTFNCPTPSQFVADHTCRRRSPRAALFRLTASQEQLAAVICRCLPLKMRMRCVRSGHWCRDSLHKAVDGSSVDQDACDQIMSYSPGWAHISQGFSCPLAAGIGSPASGHTSRHR